MNIEEIKKQAIEDLNIENEKNTRDKIKGIIRIISRHQNTITESATKIAELKKELHEIEVIEGVITKNIL